MATPLSRAEGRGSIEVQHLRRLAGAAYCGRALTLGGGFGSSDASGTPTADSARTPSLRCVFCRGRIGVLRLFFRPVGALTGPVGGGSWRRPVAAAVTGCPAASVPGPWKCALTSVLLAVLASCSSSTLPPPAASSSVPVSIVPPPAPGTATMLASGPPVVGSVLVAPAPSGPVTAAQLGSPEAAASTWLSRWCAFDWRTPLGTRENLAHPVMTERGWLNFDPLTSPASAKAWAAIVAGRQSAVCSAPVALVSPEAPRSQTGAYVIVTANRVVTPEGGTPVVEQVRQTRQVLFREGRWLVDIAADAG